MRPTPRDNNHATIEGGTALAFSDDTVRKLPLLRPDSGLLSPGAGPVGLLAALLGVQRGLEVHVFDRVTDGPKPGLVRDLGAIYHTDTLTGSGFARM